MLISIIIPVYNAEKTLSKCLDSVKNQTYQNLEIILVNDGSSDQSGLICDEYSRKDDRFTIIHKKNGGVSSARNAALRIANGKYIGFVDPDDWIEPCMFEKLYKLIVEHHADMSICGYFKEKEDGKLLNNITESHTICYNQHEALDVILDSESVKGYLWNKLYSIDVIRANNIMFNEEIHFCEDLLFNCQYILNSKTIINDTTPYYHYIIHENNASQSQFSLKKLTSLNALEIIINLLNGTESVDSTKFKNYYMHMNISLLMNAMQKKKCNKNLRVNLKKNLFKFKVNSLSNKSVKLSCIIGRINVRFLYFVWKSFSKMS
ncbi:glycosyltransferase [Heyndrickxia sporothermodurans]|uniref:glycosyltransferase family 2 protein n=1 Tax=Heyndrickxia sporothermodurans TaxID=46224 RepID=UPI002DB9B35F|nr:glycosyltransferase [Heyndrickxia sporothermodurans]MEB6548866.1 glycosyltransferase [Heyndrickxia sporothermodurans]